MLFKKRVKKNIGSEAYVSLRYILQFILYRKNNSQESRGFLPC